MLVGPLCAAEASDMERKIEEFVVNPFSNALLARVYLRPPRSHSSNSVPKQTRL